MATKLTGKNPITDAEFNLIAERMRYIADTAPTNFHEGKPCFAYYHPVSKEVFDRFASMGIQFHKTPRTIRFYVPNKNSNAYKALIAATKGMPSDIIEAQKASIERMKKKAKDKEKAAKADTATAKADIKVKAEKKSAATAKATTAKKTAKADTKVKAEKKSATAAKADTKVKAIKAAQPIAKPADAVPASSSETAKAE